MAMEKPKVLGWMSKEEVAKLPRMCQGKLPIPIMDHPPAEFYLKKEEMQAMAKKMELSPFDNTVEYMNFWLEHLKRDHEHYAELMWKRNVVATVCMFQYNTLIKGRLAEIPGAIDILMETALWFEHTKKAHPTKCQTPLAGMLHSMGHTVPGTPFENYYGQHAIKHEKLGECTWLSEAMKTYVPEPATIDVSDAPAPAATPAAAPAKEAAAAFSDEDDLPF